ncbi:monosaccharide ABC transporter substrate-binding protein (CUT2 family) [Halomonas ventosae]|uniref:Monosaccharide ABC transporter substrate-binding protein (CUT2 family) n=1 Tax=Halomonas ventosae TaxID=229007 RepID=A0A4R6ZVA1_9GAMM|nr:sugar ABC transporter substrate-binding protein [Halomonas ventosae]TDR56159.1 monosaccharide ABC transporter substrate-binding protein (CUT2 family) [Halomonas ventosae]
MKRLLLGAAVLATCSSSAMAATIGVSVAYFDDNFLTTMRNAMQAEADAQGHDIQFLDAQGDIGRQLSQTQSLSAQDVDAIIINPVDTAATGKMTEVAVQNGIPLVYVNRQPEGSDLENEDVVFVGSDQKLSGTLQMEALAEMLGGEGNVAIMLGELSSGATHQRTEGVKEVAAEYPGIEIIAEQPADYLRTEAINLMNNWIVGGQQIDAIAANNDEMALGALIAMKQSGISPDDILVGGIDATRDALEAMKRGELAVSVFQDPVGQGGGAVESAIGLINGEDVEKIKMVPFQLVTPDNLDDFLAD